MSFLQRLRTEDERDFNAVLGELLSIPKNEAIELLEQLALEQDGTFRSRAIDGMNKLSPVKAEALALRSLNDTEWYVRVNAVFALFKLHSRNAAPLIANLLANDPDEFVRSWAAFSLGSLGDESVLPVLELAAEIDLGTNQEGVPIRETAKGSIGMIRSRLADLENHKSL